MHPKLDFAQVKKDQTLEGETPLEDVVTDTESESDIQSELSAPAQDPLGERPTVSINNCKKCGKSD